MASQTVNLDAGAVEYTYPVTITGDSDISGDTVQIALGSYDLPTTWVAPDLVARPTPQSAQMQLLLGNTLRPAAGFWWVWTYVQDNPEHIARRTQLRVRVVNSGTSNLTPPVDNGDGTVTVSASATDNGDGTVTLTF